ncbi:MAG: glycosyltransferase family 1 protein [Sphingomonadaceae bacterium]|nr:glycosyltransferase family 1 protein [Sphingomonadaceae bacterium]
MPASAALRDDAAARAAPRACASAPSAEGLRVALFSGNYNCVRDGANRALNKLVGHLLERGAAVRIYSPTVPEPAFAPAGDLVSVPSIGIPGRPEYRVALGLPGAVREDVRAFAPTHVHVSCPDLLGGRAQALGRALGAPVVASMHTRFEAYPAYYGLDFLTPAVKRRLKTFYVGSDLVLAPNPSMAASLEDLGVAAERLRIWGRGVDHQQFSASRRSEAWRSAHGYRPNEPVLLFFGRVVREKGLDTFAETVKALEARGLALRPLIIGDGPARSWLETQLPGALFTGHLDGDALGRAVASADILVNPSTSEAFGNVNLEAMAAGLAVVSADVGSAQALIEDGRSGLLVPPEEPEAYADAVEGMIRAPKRRRALALAATAASAAYSWTDILDGVILAYQSVGI